MQAFNLLMQAAQAIAQVVIVLAQIAGAVLGK
jgi:hypothetical protein